MQSTRVNGHGIIWSILYLPCWGYCFLSRDRDPLILLSYRRHSYCCIGRYWSWRFTSTFI